MILDVPGSEPFKNLNRPKTVKPLKTANHRKPPKTVQTSQKLLSCDVQQNFEEANEIAGKITFHVTERS